MVEKIAFTKEEIESRVKVPAIVEVELKHLIEAQAERTLLQNFFEDKDIRISGQKVSGKVL